MGDSYQLQDLPLRSGLTHSQTTPEDLPMLSPMSLFRTPNLVSRSIPQTHVVSLLILSAALVLPSAFVATAYAQAPAAAAANPNAPQRGTVKAVAGSSLTVATDGGKQITINVADTARIQQLAPGSTDLKTAAAAQLSDIGVGDRVLVAGKAGDAPDTFNATRVILMKSGDIAQLQAQQKQDWQRRGVGGIVSAVDPATGTITLSSGAKKIAVTTTPKTIFRRYASDSVKFEDAKLGTLPDTHAGDQIQVRGAKSDDGTSIAAEEIVSGTFTNLSGLVASVNAAAGTLTLKDLATKKMVTVQVTANADVRKLPLEMATRFAARAHGGGAGGAGGGAGAGGGRPAGAEGGGGAPGGEGSRGPGGGMGGGGMGGGGGRGAGMDLSRMLSRLPEEKLSELKTGDAVMIVASETQPGAASVTAVTVLSGVEPILAASPSGSAPAMTLSPWSMGGAPEMGGGGGQ
jgi:hypothetical protein